MEADAGAHVMDGLADEEWHDHDEDVHLLCQIFFKKKGYRKQASHSLRGKLKHRTYAVRS